MAIAGWYDDPTIPGGKRFWDGTQWTEHTQPPPTAPPAPGAMAGAPTMAMTQPPAIGAATEWQPPVPDHFQGRQAIYNGPRIPEVGDWIKRSFAMTFERFTPLLMLFLPQLVLGALAYLAFHQSLANAFVDLDSGAFQGFNSGLLAAAGLLYLILMVVGAVLSLAGHHSLYAGHVGQPATAGQSFSAGLRSFPRYLGVMLLINLAMFVALGLIGAIFVGLIALTGESAAGLAVLFFILFYFGFLIGMIWLSVKLGFIAVGSTVIPKGTSVIKTSWNLTRGNFWAIFGRQLLLGLILGMIGMVVYIIVYVSSIMFIFSTFGLTGDEFTINGQDVETLDFLLFSDVLPNPVAMIAIFGTISAVVYFIQTIGHSGKAALYADLHGPNTFGHGQRVEQHQDW